jgi:integrase
VATISQRDRSVLRRFEVFCAIEGITSATALGDPAVVEAFLAIGCSRLALHSLGTYRSALRHLGEIEATSSVAAEFPGSRAAHPYDSQELAALSSIVGHQPSPARIANATVLLATMVGAGLRPGEVAQLRRGDIEQRGGEPLVTVRGRYPRTIPVLHPYREALWRVASSRRDFLFRRGASVRRTKNLVGEICARLVRDRDDVALQSARARATFICHHLRSATPLAELCELAGLQSVESLLRYARHVSSAPQSKAALRARVR